MVRIFYFLLVAISSPFFSKGQHDLDLDKILEGQLEKIRLKNKVPAIGAAIIKADGRIYVGVAGEKNTSSHLKASKEDNWHIGSCSKAFTSTLVAKLVEQAKINWNTKIKNVFPEECKNFKNAIGEVSIAQLLSHRSGVKRDFTETEYSQLSKSSDKYYNALLLAGQDEKYLQHTNFSYSNVDYILSAAIIEKVTGDSYENNIKCLFKTLKIESAVFSDEKQNKSTIWPHYSNGTPLPEKDFHKIDHAVKRPSGGIRMNLKDWAFFILDNLKAYNGASLFLEPATYKKLHTPAYASDYGFGWIKMIFEGDTTICHTGSNGYNLANVHIYPLKGYAIIVCLNQQANDFKLTSIVISDIRKMVERGIVTPQSPNP